MIDCIPDPMATKTAVYWRISLDFVLLIPRPAFLLLVSLASPTGTRHRFALHRQPIPKVKRCVGQTVHLGMLREKENVEARARMSSTSRIYHLFQHSSHIHQYLCHTMIGARYHYWDVSHL